MSELSVDNIKLIKVKKKTRRWKLCPPQPSSSYHEFPQAHRVDPTKIFCIKKLYNTTRQIANIYLFLGQITHKFTRYKTFSNHASISLIYVFISKPYSNII